MSEKIIRIEEVSFKKAKDDWQEFDGYQVITDKQTIKLGISNSQSCCESFGHFMSEDNLKEFEGANLLEVSLTDTSLNTKKIEELYLDEGQTMFVNFQTSKGLLQFTAYNSHNGYYGHDAIVISEQLKHETSL